MTRRVVASVGLVLVGGLVSLVGLTSLGGGPFAASSPTAPAPTPTLVATGPVVLVSGRDDHGLRSLLAVPLYQAPDDGTIVARVPDGFIARVLEQRGTWLKIQALLLPSAVGWIDDFYLRDRALRTDGEGQVVLVDARVAAGQVEVAVRPVTDPTAPLTWVPATLLREIGVK
jgi:hypothetical protein